MYVCTWYNTQKKEFESSDELLFNVCKCIKKIRIRSESRLAYAVVVFTLICVQFEQVLLRISSWN